jgi:hypothetical protein
MEIYWMIDAISKTDRLTLYTRSTDELVERDLSYPQHRSLSKSWRLPYGPDLKTQQVRHAELAWGAFSNFAHLHGLEIERMLQTDSIPLGLSGTFLGGDGNEFLMSVTASIPLAVADSD